MRCLANFFIIPNSPWVLLSRYTYINNPVPATRMIPMQTKVLRPMMYMMAKSISKVMMPPPRYQMYCAFSPLNSILLLMPLLTAYTLLDTEEAFDHGGDYDEKYTRSEPRRGYLARIRVAMAPFGIYLHGANQAQYRANGIH